MSVNLSANQSVCAECKASRGSSCCEPRHGEHVFLTASDVARIAATGIDPDTFVETKAFRGSQGLPDPVRAAMFRVRGEPNPVAFTVRTNGGRCMFLGDSGCTLGDAKPSLCKLFPIMPLRSRGLFSVMRNTTDAGRCLALERAGVTRAGPVTPVEIVRVAAQFGEAPAHVHANAARLAQDLAQGAAPLAALIQT